MFTLLYKSIKKLVIISLIITLLACPVTAQKYYTKNGNISFFSTTNLENISADNNQVVSVLNAQNGELQFSVLIKGFHFKKALMEEHFNENYLESDKFPKATFKGNITDIAKINFTADGSYNTTVTGDLTIHGVTQKVSSNGVITVKAGKINATAKFKAKPSDYNISIPKLVKDNIAETIEVTVNCDYDQKM
ncbi:MAG: YceI family protein [Ferruginibacter sp.]